MQKKKEREGERKRKKIKKSYLSKEPYVIRTHTSTLRMQCISLGSVYI